jgi:hypothetical protein
MFTECSLNVPWTQCIFYNTSAHPRHSQRMHNPSLFQVKQHPTLNILKHFETFWNILKHFETFWNVLKHSETFWNILKHFDTFWNILKHFETFWNILRPRFPAQRWAGPNGKYLVCLFVTVSPILSDMVSVNLSSWTSQMARAWRQILLHGGGGA